MSTTTPKHQRRPRWAPRVSAVIVALTHSRYTLRRAARRAGDRRLSHRLRRLANRKRAAAADLARDKPPSTDPADSKTEVPAPFLGDEIRTATEIGSLAASLRSNRKLRAAVEHALAANPPTRIRQKLERLRDETDRESGTLNARLGELAIPPLQMADATGSGNSE